MYKRQIERDGKDYTTTFLEKENLIAIVAYNLANTEREGYYNIKQLTEEAIRKGYTVIGLSSSAQGETEKFINDFKLPFKFYFTDETVLKTIIRASPGIVSLNKGTIIQKLHYNDAKELRLIELPTAQPNLDFRLKHELDSIAVLDQKYRRLIQLETPEERALEGKKMGLEPADYEGNLWERQTALDSSNLTRIKYLLDTQGYIGKSLVGEPTNIAAWNVIQHNPEYIEQYLPLMKEAGKKGELPFRLVAMMEDRYLMNKGEMQIYGTQARSYGSSPSFIWPIEDPDNVNARRKEAGFTQTIEEYTQDLLDTTYVRIDINDIAKMKKMSTPLITTSN